MFGAIIGLVLLLGLARYLKAPRWISATILVGAALIVLSVRFLLPASHPIRLNADNDLDGLVVLIFVAAVAFGYSILLKAIKSRTRSIDAVAEPGYVLITQDGALSADVEELLQETEAKVSRFSVLNRAEDGSIKASGRATIRGDLAEFGTLYMQGSPENPEQYRELLAGLEQECKARGAGKALLEPMTSERKSIYEQLGFHEYAVIDLPDGQRHCLIKDLS